MKSQPDIGSDDAGRGDIEERACGSVSSPDERSARLVLFIELARGLGRLSQADRLAIGSLLFLVLSDDDLPK